MQQQCSHASARVLYELDLGQHTLFLMSDGGIDLLANDERTYLADNMISLDAEETYHLFVSLQAQFTLTGQDKAEGHADEEKDSAGMDAGKR